MLLVFATVCSLRPDLRPDPAGSREGRAKDVGAITWVLATLQGEAVPEDTKGSWGALGIWGDEWTPETGVA